MRLVGRDNLYYNGVEEHKEALLVPIRLIALDMDGTLLDPQSRLTERTIKALRAAGEKGAGIVLASGRMPCALRGFVSTLNITAPLIAYNGALIADSRTEEPMASFPVEAALAREIAAACEELNLHIQAYRGDAFCCERDNVFARDYQAFLDGPVRMEAVGRKLSEWLDFDTPKLLAIDMVERISELLPILRECFAGRVKVATSQPRFIEFVSPKAGKAVALERLSELTGIAREDIAAFGDGLNDLDMIEWAGRGYAMANAPEAVRAKADAIAPSNAEDGVAQVVEQLIERGEIVGGA